MIVKALIFGGGEIHQLELNISSRIKTGFSVVELSNPQNPTEVFFIPGAYTTWRDIKTWENYAYVTNEGGDGLLIVDLNDLTGQTYVNFTSYFNTAITYIWMKMELLYIFGTDVGNGGVIFLDVTTNPMSPSYLGTWDDYYIHDGMAEVTLFGLGAFIKENFIQLMSLIKQILKY